MKRTFNLSDVLTITTGRLVSDRHMDGVYDVLNFMTGDNLFTHQLPRAGRECEPELKRQFPQLDTPEMDFAVGELDKMLKTTSGKDESALLVSGWVSKLASKYGNAFEVSPLPTGGHEFKNPLTELVDMVGPEKVVPIVV